MSGTARSRWRTLSIPPSPLAMSRLFGDCQLAAGLTDRHFEHCLPTILSVSEGEKEANVITRLRLKSQKLGLRVKRKDSVRHTAASPTTFVSQDRVIKEPVHFRHLLRHVPRDLILSM